MNIAFSFLTLDIHAVYAKKCRGNFKEEDQSKEIGKKWKHKKCVGFKTEMQHHHQPKRLPNKNACLDTTNKGNRDVKIKFGLLYPCTATFTVFYSYLIYWAQQKKLQ